VIDAAARLAIDLQSREDALRGVGSAARERDARGRHGSLHAKCALADRRRLFVSSANLTAHALALNMELGVIVEGGRLPGEVAEHFEALMRHGVLGVM
jgi:phosphatidylserine/phosphatidylglycerophosphate/cardiolipin synthase-like enzyme